MKTFIFIKSCISIHEKQNCKFLPLTLMQKEPRTCQKFSVRTLLWQIISFYESRIDTAQRLRVLRAEWAKHRSCVKPGRGEGEDLSIAFLGVILSEELAKQQPPGQQGPGHRSAAPEGPLRQPNQAGDFTALGKKLKQENFPIKVSLILMQPGEKRPVWALVLIFTTQSFPPALLADKMCMLQERTVGKPQ